MVTPKEDNLDSDQPSLIEERDAVIDAKEVESKVGFEFLLEYQGFREVWERDIAFRDTLHFFNSAVSNLGLSESNFFENEKLKEDIAMRFVDFLKYVNEEIEDMERLFKGNDSNLGPNWRENVRKACYYAFFIHYGAKRRGELDKFGKPKDYVYHVVKAAVNCMVRKVRFFDERAILATVCHDSREDYRKGIFGLLHSDCSEINPADFDKNKKSGALAEGANLAVANEEGILAEMTEMEEALEANCLNKDLDELTVSELIEIVTKVSGDRNRAVLGLLNRILFEKDGSQRSPKRLYYALTAILIKIADRLENIKSFRSKENPDRESTNDLIEDETIYLFLAIAQKWGMTNVVDWFFDYIDLQKESEKRKHLTTLKREGYRRGEDGFSLLEKDQRLRGRFKAELRERLSDLCGRQLEEGVDYVFEYREIGHRYNDQEELAQLFVKGTLPKSLRSYIIFHPLVDNEELVTAAEIIFGDIFDQDVPVEILNRGEISRSKLGRFIAENGLIGSSEVYGYGLCGIFDSKEECVEGLLGEYVSSRVAIADGEADENLIRDVIKPFVEILPMVRNLKEEYRLLDFNDQTVAGVSRSSRRNMDSVVGKLVVDLDDVKSGGREVLGVLRSQDQIIAAEKVLAKLVMSLFMSSLVDRHISVNGKLKTTRVPASVAGDPNAALVYGAPLLVGLPHRDPNFIEGVFAALIQRLSLPMGELNAKIMAFNVNPFLEFDPDLFEEQTGFLDKLMTDYREALLNGQLEVGPLSRRDLRQMINTGQFGRVSVKE